jgi:hypothetical protein
MSPERFVKGKSERTKNKAVYELQRFRCHLNLKSNDCAVSLSQFHPNAGTAQVSNRRPIEPASSNDDRR